MPVFRSAIANLPKACEDINVSEKRFLEDVATLKEWLQQQPHLPEVVNELVVENMLLRCKGSMEVAKQAIDAFFSARTQYPELFTNTDPCSEELLCTRQMRKLYYVKDLSREGYRIAMTSLPDPKLEDDFVMQDFMKDMLMAVDLLIGEDISAGNIYIIDMSNVGLLHSTMILKNFDIFQKAMHCIFKAYRMRIKAVHFMFPPPTAHAMINLLIKVSPKKLTQRLHFHGDLASLHQHFDKEVLPEDYGGYQKTSSELSADYDAEMQTYRQWFLDHETTWLTDESKRPPDSKRFDDEDSFGMDGTFKRLEVD